MIILAADTGGAKTPAALISDDDSLSLKKQISTPHERCPDEVTGALCLLVSEMKGTAGRFAVASTRVISNGILTAPSPGNLGGLKEYPLRNIMEDITGLNGSVINDAQVATWVEYTVLPKEIYNTVFITASTGAEGGIVVNRKLLTGVSRLAGRVGHISSGITDAECGCGCRGHAEAASSGRAIMGAAKNKLVGYSTKYILELAR